MSTIVTVVLWLGVVAACCITAALILLLWWSRSVEDPADPFRPVHDERWRKSEAEHLFAILRRLKERDED